MILSVINNKGGTGKTTTAVNLAAALAEDGVRALVVDLDAQASASFALGVPYQAFRPSILDVLHGRAGADAAVRELGPGFPDLLTGDPDLAHFDLVFGRMAGRENLLKRSLVSLYSSYEVIVCDCAPALSLLSVNALVASDAYLVPTTAEYLALEGLIGIQRAVDRVVRGLGSPVRSLGILFTQVTPFRPWWPDRSSRAQRRVVELVRNQYGDAVFRTEIPRHPSVAEAPGRGKTIFRHAPRSPAASAYEALVREVMQRVNGVGASAGNQEIVPETVRNETRVEPDPTTPGG